MYKMRYFFFLLFFNLVFIDAQVINKTDSNTIKQDTIVVDSGINDSLKIFRPTIEDYKFFNQFSEKKVLDTTLSNDKTFIFSQWNNRDNFGKIQFANIGSGFNPLMYEYNAEQNLALLPINKSFGILGINEVKYYDVKTPTTTFVYHNAMRNGAALNSTYTQNVGKNFNFSLEYMGLRSQGNYKESLAANNNTIFTGNYRSKDNKYEAFAHFIHQNVTNQENGGIVNNELYLNGDDAYRNKSNVEVRLNGSNSRFSYRRYYLSHQFAPFNVEKFPFKIRHTIFHQSNKYFYGDASPQPLYTNADTSGLLVGYPLFTGKYSRNLSNTVSLLWDNERFKMDAGVRHQLLNLGVSDEAVIGNLTVPEGIRENRFGIVGNLNIDILNTISLISGLEFSKGEKFGNFLRSTNKLRFEPIEGYFVDGKVNFQSATPSFNYHLNASPYLRFNYFTTDLKNQNILEVGGNVNLKWFNTQLFVNYFRIDNFTYFDSDALPKQSNSSVNISQIGGDATFAFKKIHLQTKLLFQNTLTNKDLFPSPSVIARANLYYQTKAFKNAAEIQTGIKGYYFSNFNSRDYFPMLNEFSLPNTEAFSIGGRPVLDAYFNLKVKRMFFFIEGQHFTTLIKNNTVYTAPHFPLYDFRLNIGIVWYLIN